MDQRRRTTIFVRALLEEVHRRLAIAGEDDDKAEAGEQLCDHLLAQPVVLRGLAGRKREACAGSSSSFQSDLSS